MAISSGPPSPLLALIRISSPRLAAAAAAAVTAMADSVPAPKNWGDDREDDGPPPPPPSPSPASLAPPPAPPSSINRSRISILRCASFSSPWALYILSFCWVVRSWKASSMSLEMSPLIASSGVTSTCGFRLAGRRRRRRRRNRVRGSGHASYACRKQALEAKNINIDCQIEEKLGWMGAKGRWNFGITVVVTLSPTRA